MTADDEIYSLMVGKIAGGLSDLSWFLRYKIFYGFEIALFVRNLTDELLGKVVRIEELFYSKTFFEEISKDNYTAKKRL